MFTPSLFSRLNDLELQGEEGSQHYVSTKKIAQNGAKVSRIARQKCTKMKMQNLTSHFMNNAVFIKLNSVHSHDV